MSGQQIGTVVGAAVGFYFGGVQGAQLGMAIGGLVGGAVDPTKINGPQIGDGQQQTSTDGVPIAWVQGTATVAGTLVQFSKRRSVKVKDSGKGGPVVSHYEAHQDFAFVICESCESRDSVMSNVVMVTQDGILVYDVRPGSTMMTQSLKWKAGVDFQYGHEDQLPHPTLEAITGVGNQVAYRGYLTAVFRNFNVTKTGDRIPTFSFTVSSSSGYVVLPSSSWRYLITTYGGPNTYAATNYDDSGWPVAHAPFGNPIDYVPNSPTVFKTVNTLVNLPDTIWMRTEFYLGSIPSAGLQMQAAGDDSLAVYINGSLIATAVWGVGFPGTFTIPASALVVGKNIVAARGDDGRYLVASYFDLCILASSDDIYLANVVSKISQRGGLQLSNFDASVLSTIVVKGYPIARLSSAADCLAPLLAAYFSYASEYDAKLNFNLYGGVADLTIDPNDILEGNDANGGNITKNLRNQATEFPRRIVASYIDPSQNYYICQVSATRIAIDVKAIGDQTIQIPVVMTATQAKQAVEKAMKVAYATLEGKLEYSVPFGGSAAYLMLCGGESVNLNGKRYVLDEVIVSNGYLKLTTRYDRQSAYTSNVQAIAGNVPSVPPSPYSGPSQLQVLNLPSLRPQDTYGLYLAAASASGSPDWQGCNVLMSLDGQVTWNSVASITGGSILGALTQAEPAGHEPLTVQVNGDLETITAAQFAANGNAFAITTAGVSEIGQFQTVTELTTPDLFQLTGTRRGLNGTAQAMHSVGDLFTMLDNVYFVAIDVSFTGKMIYFKAPGFGEDATTASVSSVVYSPNTTIVYNGGKTGT